MPEFPSPEVRQLEQLLREKLLPWAENEAPFVLFDAPPRCLTPLKIEEHSKPPLPETQGERAYPHVQRWREQQLNATSAPMLGCVFDGEADYRVNRPPGENGGQWTLTLKTGTFFFIAPGIPFSDGSKVAWERPHPEKAYSRVILMQLNPEGVICHSFASDKGKLWLHPYLFLYNFEVLPLGEKLLGEMRRQRPLPSVIYLYWQLILHLLVRTINEGDVSTLHGASASSAGMNKETILHMSALKNKFAVQLAEQYIESHLDDSSLKVLSITQHVGLSERHLNRLFKGINGVSLSGYVQQKRLDKARVLLQHSRLPIRQVANYCGFGSVSHFTTWFGRQMHQSPRQFRRLKNELS